MHSRILICAQLNVSKLSWAVSVGLGWVEYIHGKDIGAQRCRSRKQIVSNSTSGPFLGRKCSLILEHFFRLWTFLIYVSINQHPPESTSINQHQPALFRINQHQSSMRVNENQSVTISINQRQSAPISNQHQSASSSINQHQPASMRVHNNQSVPNSINQHQSAPIRINEQQICKI